MPNENEKLMGRLIGRRFVNEESGCWEWMGAKNKGYGLVKISGRMLRVHRVMAVLCSDLDDYDDKDFVVRHTCDNPSCFNPEHLLVGTVDDNFQDRFERNRLGKVAKLTPEDVKDIKTSYAAGVTQRELGLRYNVRQDHISNIITGKNWGRLSSNLKGD
jgi:hypothetical protein